MFCRVVARSNQDLQRVIDMVVDVEGVERASTVISLATQVPYRVVPLVEVAASAPAAAQAGAGAAGGDPGAPAGASGRAAGEGAGLG
jgi:hypothetical protein